MRIKCDRCGYEDSNAEFRFLGHADSAGSDCYRQCPKCHHAIYCEEIGEPEDYSGQGVFGISRLRGRVFKRPDDKD